jgi:hypothetical protein
MPPFASRSSVAIDVMSNVPATTIEDALTVGLALPGRVTAPIRSVPAVMPWVFCSDGPETAPSVTSNEDVAGAYSNTPEAPAFTTPVAPVTPRLTRLSARMPIVPPPWETSDPPAANVSALVPVVTNAPPEVTPTVPAIVMAVLSTTSSEPVARKPLIVPIAFEVPRSSAVPETPFALVSTPAISVPAAA